MSAAVDPWRGFGFQAAAVAFVMPLAIALQFTAAQALLGDDFGLGAVVFVFVFGFLFGLAPSLLASATLRSWRNARRDSPFAIASSFALPLLAAGAIFWRAEPSGNVFVLAVLAALGVGGVCSVMAAARTGRTSPALFALFAGLLTTLAAVFLVFLYAESAGGLSPMLAAANLAVASFVGAVVYSAAEPKPRARTPRAVQA